jgi:hypothetical protein
MIKLFLTAFRPELVEGRNQLQIHADTIYGPVISVNRPVRTRMPGGVGAGPPPGYPIIYIVR